MTADFEQKQGTSPKPGTLAQIVGYGVFALVCVSFVYYFSLCAVKVSWIGDFHVYIAAVSALYENFWRPAHEAMAVASKYSFAYTPYMVAVAAVGKIYGLSEYAALQWAGIFNVTLYLVALYTFFRVTSVTNFPHVSATFFLLISLFLRNETYIWSSETSFDTLRLIQAYPSFFAWSLALFVFAGLEAFFRRMRLSHALTIAVLSGLLFLVHQITASWVIGIILVRTILEIAVNSSSTGREARKRYAALIALIFLVLILASFWPYSSLRELSNYAGVSEGAPFGLGWAPLTSFLWLYLLGIPCLVYLFYRQRGKVLVIGFLATACAFLAFRLFEISYGFRYVFFMAFFAQVAVAECSTIGVRNLLSALRHPKVTWQTQKATGMALTAVAVGSLLAVFTSPVFERSWHEVKQGGLFSVAKLRASEDAAEIYYSKHPELKQFLSEGDVVLISPKDALSYDIAVLTGARAVVVNYASIVPDYSSRMKDVKLFLSPGVAVEDQVSIVRKYDVSHVILTKQSNTLHVREELEKWLGPPTADTGALVLFKTGRQL